MSHVIILAGGKGTRMKSELPKVLHPVKGVPIITRLLKNIESFCSDPTLIVGHKHEEVRKETGNKYHYVLQEQQLGTGHAIMCAKPDLEDKEYKEIVVLPGDHPLVSTETLNNLVKIHKDTQATVTLATAVVENFTGENAHFLHYGRVIRNKDGSVAKIVEYKDASEEERACTEVNLSYYCFDADWLWKNIDTLKSNNMAHEYYLTDMIKLAKDQGKIVSAYPISALHESLGINSPEQLLMVEATLV